MAEDDPRRGEPIVALLIDYENVADVPLKDIFRVAAVEGRVAIRRIYGNAPLIAKYQDAIRDLAFEPVSILRSNRSGKNATDIYLTIDAIDLLHRGIVDTFVLATSDSDFARLARRIREGGRRVVGAGNQDRVGEALVQSCDQFVRLPLSKGEKVQDATEPKEVNVPGADVMTTKDLVQLAFDSAIDETGSTNGGKLHATIQRLDPAFDYKSLGHKSFRDFLENGSGLPLIVDPDPPMMVTMRDEPAPKKKVPAKKARRKRTSSR